ncbi:ParA family protein [Laceyella putida]|uniref:ParA family protein n=1 Tax=Laceyella putida TaxID=110101 RepID=A0ABW2RF16_9BACL
MGITISFGLQKGGVGKTTTTAITAYLLAKNHKVLAIDFDSQGNLTQMLTTEDVYQFTGKTILEAIQEKNAEPYIVEVNENLHLLPAEDLLALLPNKLVELYSDRKDQLASLRNLLAPIRDRYDYILVDLPPNVGDHTLCGLVASDYAVVVMQTEPFAFNALERYLETMELAQEMSNPDLRLAGILTCLMNQQTSIDNAIRLQAVEDYETLVFETVIKRKARIKEFSLEGIQDRTKADRDALEQYQSFVEELLARVKA